MNKTFRIRFGLSHSDNRKSKIQNRKWAGFLAVVVALMVCGARAEAQQPKKVLRIGYLGATDPAGESIRSEAIRLALRELGYIEGQNITTEYRYAQGKRDRYADLAAELVRLKVDIIVVAGAALAIRAAMNASKTIPIVMTGQGADPVALGFIESLARPGGNITGLTNLSGEMRPTHRRRAGPEPAHAAKPTAPVPQAATRAPCARRPHRVRLPQPASPGGATM